MHLMVLKLCIIYAILTVGSSAKFAHIAQDGVHIVCSAYGRGDHDYREWHEWQETGGDGTEVQGSTG